MLKNNKFALKKYFSASLSLWLLAAPYAVSANEEAPEMELELEEFVVVATRTPLKLEQVSPSVEYIGLDSIKFWQSTHLTDLLSRQSGINMKSQGSQGSVTSLFLRGANSDQAALFLDGRRINPTLSGQSNLEFLTVDNLNSVQIQKGASSVNYGTSGIGGVVDMRSAKTLGKKSTQGEISAGIGTNDFQHANLKFTTSTEDWGVSISNSFLSSHNERPNDRIETYNTNIRSDIRLTPYLTAEVIGSFGKAEKQVPGPITSPSPNALNESISWMVSPGIRYENNDFNIHAFYIREIFKFDNTFNSGYLDETRMRGNTFDFQADYNGISGLTLSLGGLYRNEKIRLPMSSYAEDLSQTGIFTQSLWQLSEAFEIRGGMRYDTFSDYDNDWSWNLEAIHFVPNSELSVFTKIATSYAPPSGQDLAYDSNKDASNNSVNTPLSPEESLSYEIGFRHSFLDEKVKWSLVIFRNDIENLINYVSYPPVGSNYPSDTFNTSSATTQGAEFSLDYELSERLAVTLDYTYLSAVADAYIGTESKYVEQRLAYRPKHLIQLSARYQPTDALKIGVSVVGQMNREHANFQDYNTEIEDFVIINLVSEYQLSETFSLQGRVDNLLNECYELSQSYPSMGTSIYFGARKQF